MHILVVIRVAVDDEYEPHGGEDLPCIPPNPFRVPPTSYTPQFNTWRGESSIQLLLKDIFRAI